MVALTLSYNFQYAKAHEFALKGIQVKTDLLGDAHPLTLTAIMQAGGSLLSLARRDNRYMQEAEELLLKAI